MNYNQAKMLEKALSGFDVAAKDSKTKQEKSLKSRKSVLAPNPRPSPSQSDPASGIDVVILFDVNDELCLRRASGRTRKFHEHLACWVKISADNNLEYFCFFPRI